MTEEIVLLCDTISGDKSVEYNNKRVPFVKKISSYKMEIYNEIRNLGVYSLGNPNISTIVDFVYDLMLSNDIVYLMSKNISYDVDFSNRTCYTIDVSKARRKDTGLLLTISDSKITYGTYYIFTKSSNLVLGEEKIFIDYKSVDIFALYTDSIPPKFYGKPMKDKFNNMYGSIMRVDVIGLLKIVYSCFKTSTKVCIIALNGSTKKHLKDDPVEFIIDLSNMTCIDVYKKLHSCESNLESGNCISFINGKEEMWNKKEILNEITKPDFLYYGVKYEPEIH